MQSKKFTAAAGVNETFLITKPVAKLLVIRRLTGAGVETKRVMANGPERVSISINSKTGRQIPICTRRLLRDLAFLAQMGEGAASENNLGAVDTTQSYSHSRVCIELGLERAVRLLDGEEIEITIFDALAGGVYEVYGIEYPEVGTTVNEYSPLQIQAGLSQKMFNVDAASGLLLQNVFKIERIQVVFANGYSANYSQEEILALNADMNDIIYVENGLVITSYNHSQQFFPLKEAVSIEVFTDSTAIEMVLVTPKSVL